MSRDTQIGSVFSSAETHSRVLHGQSRLIAHSESIGWRSLYAVIVDPPAQCTEPPARHPSFIYHLRHPTIVDRKIESDRRERALIGPRQICLTPGAATTQWEHSGHIEILHVYVRQSIYESVVAEMYGCDGSQAEIVPRWAILDPLLEQVAITISDAVADGTLEDGLYVDTLAHMVAAHLARWHSHKSNKVPGPPARVLSGSKMRRLIEFVEENLDRDLRLEAMAREVGMSPLYLSHAFKTSIGQSPHRYILARRVERARGLLRDTDLPISDVALSCGFSSQSHLSNWFFRMVGVSPAAYRKESAR